MTQRQLSWHCSETSEYLQLVSFATSSRSSLYRTMAFRGERFEIDLDSDPEDVPPPSLTLSIPGVIGEIQERSPPAPPAPPALKSASGFPAHRRRTKPYAFKKRQAQSGVTPTASKEPVSGPQDEKTAIHEQNRQQMAAMSDAQIRQERDELMSSLDTSLLERFLRRARLDDEAPSPSRPPTSAKGDTQNPPAPPAPPAPSSPEPASAPAPRENPPTKSDTFHGDDIAPSTVPDDLFAAAEFPPSGSVHFPTPLSRSANMPTLDPS